MVSIGRGHVAALCRGPFSTRMGDSPPRSTQPSILWVSLIEYQLTWLDLRRGEFTCVGWQVTLRKPLWQAASRSSEVGFPSRAGGTATVAPPPFRPGNAAPCGSRPLVPHIIVD